MKRGPAGGAYRFSDPHGNPANDRDNMIRGSRCRGHLGTFGDRLQFRIACRRPPRNELRQEVLAEEHGASPNRAGVYRLQSRR